MATATAASEGARSSAFTGELLVVIGPPGARRTSLLRDLAERLRPAGDALRLDDPDAGLDAAARVRMWSALRRTAEAGATVIAACTSAESAGAAPHRTVLLPR
ncbi:ABC transporter ATP-binding protein [Streptomyces sp. RB6PN25]|uniref:ABC transporter ATP-binding protein n=1 Tax=Streptomyces humicola TaxID=2953240 RepID=A0ABT1PYF5_9ACTN|nr:ABC transporter ATP-binding protein [Streptomyces humicola]MCQ4082692.1 ABC transporter ATP-binding protein [Streptomyces humicola]